jgi:hypothetical protein
MRAEIHQIGPSSCIRTEPEGAERARHTGDGLSFKGPTTTAGLLSSPANAEALGKLGGSLFAVALPMMIDRKRLTFFHYSKHIK